MSEDGGNWGKKTFDFCLETFLSILQSNWRKLEKKNWNKQCWLKDLKNTYIFFPRSTVFSVFHIVLHLIIAGGGEFSPIEDVFLLRKGLWKFLIFSDSLFPIVNLTKCSSLFI